MKVLIVSHYFPNSSSVIYAWLSPLVEAFAKLGNECVVLCPYSITFRRRLYRKKQIIALSGCPGITVLRPGYFLTRNRQKVMARALQRLQFVPDCVYGKFWKGAYLGYEYARTKHIPLFVDCGESSVAEKFMRSSDCEEFCNYVSGVVCTSAKNRDECVELGLASADKCLVAINAVSHDVFHKMDREECRRRLGIPQRDFVVISVGWFETRKGINRVAEAIERLAEEDLSALFVGDGSDIPHCRNIRFCGIVRHEDIPLYLNAADVFVLPTLAEGCCNSIVEAMACGLPIVSSDRPFNMEILGPDNSVLVDPLDIGQIADAIMMLKSNPEKRGKMAVASLSRAEELTIESRAECICSFIESRIAR